MDCRGRDYALFRVRTPVILSPRARLGTARVSAYGGQAGGYSQIWPRLVGVQD